MNTGTIRRASEWNAVSVHVDWKQCVMLEILYRALFGRCCDTAAEVLCKPVFSFSFETMCAVQCESDDCG